MDSKTQTHAVIDGRTGTVMGKYRSAKRAYARADRLDREYGGVRYCVQPLSWAVHVADQKGVQS